jgi:phosphate transport system ATP-binding protein
MSEAPELELDGVHVRYGSRAAISDASFQVPGGSIMALVGPSGCGKSSLLTSINRLTDTVPDCRISGAIRIGGRPLEAWPDAAALRRTVGMVFQHPNPFPLSVLDNLTFPMAEHRIPKKQRSRRAEDALRSVGLWDEVNHHLHQSALTLSGGQQQRLCLARALVLEPQVLLLDEPCSALDPMASAAVEELITSLRGRYTILMVTHNLAQARRIADQVTVCWMEAGCGCVVESGDNEQIFAHARHPVTRAYCAGECG